MYISSAKNACDKKAAWASQGWTRSQDHQCRSTLTTRFHRKHFADSNYSSFSSLEDTPNNTHNLTLPTTPPNLLPQLIHTLPAHLRIRVLAADRDLAVPHASVDIDLVNGDPQRAVFGALEPGVNLPHEIEEDEQGAGEVEVEEGFDVEVGSADGVQGDVELGDEREAADQDADVGAVDAEGGFVGEFVEAVAVCFPRGGCQFGWVQGRVLR